jgi:NADPH-dependent glutamate synthase beta subunit-like oxidoreductase/bacterioferritin-associated ferredoxin
MKEVRIQAVVDAAKCVGCDTCTHVCPTMAYTPPERRPLEQHMLPPCTAACPIGNDAEGFVTLVQQGKWDEALRLLRTTNPLPGVTGRVCSGFCEMACNRGKFDESVSVKALERAIADYAAGKPPERLEVEHRHTERIAVIGSGPAGLSCAYHLTRRGFRVTLFEQKSQIGGALRYGIPAYRLPRDVLDREIEQLKMSGIDFRLNKRYGHNLRAQDLQNYEAVYLALGLQKNIGFGLAGEDCPQVVDGLSFLERVNSGETPEMGGRVLIVGGGNTAVASARSALRLGSKPALIFEGSEKDMTALSSEVDELKNEGVEILFFTVPMDLVFEDGRLTKVLCRETEPVGEEKVGWRRGKPSSGSEFTIPADLVINCLGETGDLEGVPSELKVENDRILTDSWGKTSMPKIFVGGDVAAGKCSVAHAIGSGRRGADAIAAYLSGEPDVYDAPKKPVVSAAQMNFDYCDRTPKLGLLRIHREDAISSFEEIKRTPAPEASVSEAERCLHCGVMPEFHPEHCLGCANCSSRCPAYAISIKELENPYVVQVDLEDDLMEEARQICLRAGFNPKLRVCACTGTKVMEVATAILKGAETPQEVSRATGVRTGCTMCIEPVLCILEAAGCDLRASQSSHIWYPAVVTIWDVPETIIEGFQDRGFRFEEDKDFYKKIGRQRMR